MSYSFDSFTSVVVDMMNQVLKNGVEVKLQRNALSVLEPPTGNEEDDDYDFDDSSSCSDVGEKEHPRFSTFYHLPCNAFTYQYNNFLDKMIVASIFNNPALL